MLIEDGQFSDKLLLYEAVQNDIIKYIKERRLINFRYDSPVDGDNEGYYRNVEPYVLGISKAGNLVLRAWQTNLSSSVTGSKPNWRLFRLDGISEVLPVPQKFTDDIATLKRTRPGYNQGDREMTKIIASVAPLTPNSVNVDKNTKAGSKVKTTSNQKSFFQQQAKDFAKNQKQKKATLPKEKEKSVFNTQSQKMKIPVVKKQEPHKKKVDRGWMKNQFDDFAKKEISKSKQKKKGFSK